jgi:putative glutamine amidotransferase
MPFESTRIARLSVGTGGFDVRHGPVIGIATQTVEAVPGELPPGWAMGQCYVRVLVGVGALPWLIPLLHGNEMTLRAIYDRLDGVFLTGGADIDPTAYGEERHPSCQHTDPARDWTELRLIRWALADHKPLFGICRGIQAINVACGGSLYQDVGEQLPHAIKHNYSPTTDHTARDYLAHPVRLASGSRVGRLLGIEQIEVNSMHHQGIKGLAPGLTATAFAPDGLVESIERTDNCFQIGVQWHPEEMAESHPMRRLFSAFVEAARVYAGARAA